MAKQVQKYPSIIQRVHYKHGDTPLVQTTEVPDACLAWPATASAYSPLSTARAESISLLATAACASQLGHSHGPTVVIHSFIHSAMLAASYYRASAGSR